MSVCEKTASKAFSHTDSDTRNAAIDHLRVVLTLLVILHRVAIACSGSAGWYLRERTTGAGAVLQLLIVVNQAFFMGFFFLLAGYLFAVIDWYSRAVLAWELSNALDASFCVQAVARAMAQHGILEIFNTVHQGCQFTSAEFPHPLLARGVKISMDGRGRALDNVFVERFWRTVKYDEVYLKSYSSQIDAYTNLNTFIAAGPCHGRAPTL